MTTTDRSQIAEAKVKPNVLADFLKTFLVPTLVNKFFMIYFGLNYSNSPGEGYGYGLVATIAFLFFTMGRFIWKYQGIEDP